MKANTRIDGRSPDALRKINIIEDYVSSAEASYLIEVGQTRILCNATIENTVPRWLKGKGKGWVTAEYSLLPRSTSERVKRERGSISGRTQEIQRLIGRALRGVCDLEALGERNIIIDCDVLEADGGTRCASIVGAFMALVKAIQNADIKSNKEDTPIIQSWLSAVSVGVLEGNPILDLCYQEDSKAEVDMNIIMTDLKEYVEIQGTGEEATYNRPTLNKLLDLGEKGCMELIAIQQQYLGLLP
jgi:ribonuclease PH